MQHIKENAAQAPYLPNKRTGPGKAFDKMYSEMKKATESRNCHDIGLPPNPPASWKNVVE